jgi:hypothetical protein
MEKKKNSKREVHQANSSVSRRGQCPHVVGRAREDQTVTEGRCLSQGRSKSENQREDHLVSLKLLEPIFSFRIIRTLTKLCVD